MPINSSPAHFVQASQAVLAAVPMTVMPAESCGQTASIAAVVDPLSTVGSSETHPWPALQLREAETLNSTAASRGRSARISCRVAKCTRTTARCNRDGAAIANAAAMRQNAQLPAFAPLLEELEVAGWSSHRRMLSGNFHDWSLLEGRTLLVMAGQAIAAQPNESIDPIEAALVAQGAWASIRSHAHHAGDAGTLLSLAAQSLWSKLACACGRRSGRLRWRTSECRGGRRLRGVQCERRAVTKLPVANRRLERSRTSCISATRFSSHFASELCSLPMNHNAGRQIIVENRDCFAGWMPKRIGE